MKSWEIDQYTKDLKEFAAPKRSLEQYVTKHEQASELISAINVISLNSLIRPN